LELLPRKVYGIQIIEKSMRRYVFSTDSLRQAARIPVKEQTIVYPLHHTSLHRWLSGFGEKVLDRNEWIAAKYLPTTSAIIAETCKHQGVDFPTLLPSSDVKLFSEKYRSERRKDHLTAGAWIFLIAKFLFGKNSDDVLKQWVRELLPVFNVVVWDFPCLLSVTAFHHTRPP
jgi:hypothetical protein